MPKKSIKAALDVVYDVMLLSWWRGDIGVSKREKQLLSLRNNPKNVRFETIQNILLSYQFIETAPSGGSSHFTYHRGIYRITIPKDNPVNQIYIKRAIEIIDKLEESRERFTILYGPEIPFYFRAG